MSAEFSEEVRLLMERLDRAIPPHSSAVSDANGDPLVCAAQRLAQGPAVHLPEKALDRIEARLRTHAEGLHAPQPQPTTQAPIPVTSPIVPARAARPLYRSHPAARVWRYLAAACLVIVFAVLGTARASASSLPGDPLYPVKRLIEEGRLALASPSDEPALRVEFAARRVDEFEALLDRDRVYPRALEEATDQLTRALDLIAAGQGSSPALTPRVLSVLHHQEAVIEQSTSFASPRQWERLETVVERAVRIQARLEPGLPEFTPQVTPVPLSSVVPDFAPTSSAPRPNLTRTPPGHGPTPGLGSNPPGQGGPHPGQGKSNRD